jgi:hypothetical protein
MGVEMRFTKWGGKRHWRYPLEPLGIDQYGWWLGGAAGTLQRRGFEEPVRGRHDYVTLVPSDGDWIATWNAAGDVEIYVDVTNRPMCSDGVVEAIDLDLDVIRRRDGRVEVLDEDEFAEHQVLFGYPPDVIAQARATTDNLVAQISAAEEPFGRIGLNWLAAFSAR